MAISVNLSVFGIGLDGWVEHAIGIAEAAPLIMLAKITTLFF